MDNIKRLSERFFNGNIDAAILTSPVNRKYLLGINSSAGTILLFPDKAYLIIDFRYYEMAKSKAEGFEVILQNKLFKELKELLIKHNAKTVALEEDTVTLEEYEGYKNKLSGFNIVSNSGLSEILRDMRSVKSQSELEKIITAQKITDKSFEEILNFIKVGVTERQIAARLEYIMKLNGADGLSFDTIAIAGKNTSLPHGEPSDYVIQKGDFVLMDFGALFDGYHADMTRTVAVGEISSHQKRIYDTVLQAQLMALDSIKAGQRCSDIDKIARDYINKSGYKGTFGHSLGHSVGLQIHETPNFSPNCDSILKENMVLSVEPGIYIEGDCGVRIEDLVIIKDGCAQNITSSPKNLICL